MSNAIPEFLDQSRYEGTKDFIRNVWQGNARGALMCNICAPAENPPEPPQNESEHWLDRFWQKRMYEMGQRRWGHDQAIPAIQPSTPMVGGGSQSTAFGATFEEKYNHTSPCIQTPEEIETLNLKPTLNDGLLPKKIEQIRYIVEKTAGKVPIQQENCGGPMDIVSMTMNDMNMLTGLYTHPKEIHRFMDAATELFINFFKAQREIVPEWVPVFSEDMWGPDDDSIHVGDSLAQMVLGYKSTLNATMDIMVPLTAAVRRGAPQVYLTGDMPFLSYQVSHERAILNAGRFMTQAGCDAVKLEVDYRHLDLVRALATAGIPVVAHLGYRPQSARQQDKIVLTRQADQAGQLVKDALDMIEAGACAILLECVTTLTAQAVAQRTDLPVIGCGSGPYCDGHVLVLHDVLDLPGATQARFSKTYGHIGEQIRLAVVDYVDDIHQKRFPDEQHSYSMKPDQQQAFQQWLKDFDAKA